MDQVLGLDAIEINVETGPSLSLNLESRTQHSDRREAQNLRVKGSIYMITARNIAMKPARAGGSPPASGVPPCASLAQEGVVMARADRARLSLGFRV